MYHVTATARFGPRIPGCPPLHREHDQEDMDRHPGIGNTEIGQVAQRLRIAKIGFYFLGQDADTADMLNGHNRQPDTTAHRQAELDDVRKRDTPHTGQRAINSHYGQHDDDADP